MAALHTAIAQLGERQTEDLKVPGSIPGLGNDFMHSFCLARARGHCAVNFKKFVKAYASAAMREKNVKWQRLTSMCQT